jgi:undecaprenyl-diphosphatase
MDLTQAVILGIVQGLTEFLPISSSGHLYLVPVLSGWNDPGAGFTAVIQLGTLAAVLAYFRHDLFKISRALGAGIHGRPGEGPESRLGQALAVGTVPVCVAGLAGQRWIDNEFRSPWVVATTLIVLALALALAERVGTKRRGLESVTVRDGLVVGLWQALALIPGSSRSGSTITGGLFLGLDRASAARFSFLLSVPAILISGLYKLYQERNELLGAGLAPTAVATMVSFLSGYWAIAFLMRFVQTKSMTVFVVYRLLLGLVVLALAFNGFFGHGTLRPR